MSGDKFFLGFLGALLVVCMVNADLLLDLNNRRIIYEVPEPGILFETNPFYPEGSLTNGCLDFACEVIDQYHVNCGYNCVHINGSYDSTIHDNRYYTLQEILDDNERLDICFDQYLVVS